MTISVLFHVSRYLLFEGSFSTATCRQCKDQVLIKELKDSILKEVLPVCKLVCQPSTVCLSLSLSLNRKSLTV